MHVIAQRHCFVYFTEIQCHFSQLCNNSNSNNKTSLAHRGTIFLASTVLCTYCEVERF